MRILFYFLCESPSLSPHTGWILSSFFFGYIITQIPGGWLAARIGGRWIFGIGLVMTAVLTLLTPVAAYLSIWALIAVRVAEGFFEVSGTRMIHSFHNIIVALIFFRELLFLRCTLFGPNGHHLLREVYSPPLLMQVNTLHHPRHRPLSTNL